MLLLWIPSEVFFMAFENQNTFWVLQELALQCNFLITANPILVINAALWDITS